MAETVADLACCSLEDAQKALETHGSVIAAVDSLMQKPKVSGEKFIKSVIRKSHMDEEQEERCRQGRDLMSRLTVISAYHPQVQRAPSVEEAAMKALQSHPSVPAPSEQPSVAEPQQDSPLQTVQPSVQSLTLP